MRTRRSQSSSDPVSETPSFVKTTEGGHRPVLLHEALDALAISPSDTVVDATLGGAGHAREIIQRLGTKGIFIGFDLDLDAIARAQTALADASCTAHLINANFRNIKSELQKLGVEEIDRALFDLGWSAYQLDAGRGFSFLKDEPLLMTYSKESGALTAATIVNEWAEESIADVIFGWGEERYSRRIAKRIVEQRLHRPFTTAVELADCVREAVPAAYRRGPRSKSFALQRGRRLHPATKTFQALRIAVNDELGALQEGLTGASALLAEDGRIAVITFHSIEDRLVKRLFAEWEKRGYGKRVTKKPIVPSVEELRENPRARSAKLRVFHKNLTEHEKTFGKNKQI